jgi:hypothetical protein
MTTAARSINAAGSPGLSVEPHYSPAEIAEMWKLSVDCVRKMFENEPGVLVIGGQNPHGRKRRYTTLRIPEFVLERVHRRLSKV